MSLRDIYCIWITNALNVCYSTSNFYLPISYIKLYKDLKG